MYERRYGADPNRLEGKADIVEYVRDLIKRVESGETSLRVGHTSIEDGDLIVRNGDIIVSESDDSIVLRILHGDIPEIRFFPLGDTDTHQATIFSLDNNANPSNPDQTIQIDVEKVAGNTIDGGKVLLGRNYAIISHQPDGGNESFIWINASANNDFYFKGRWANQALFDNQQGIYAGQVGIGAGFSSWTHTYATPFATTPVPIVTLISSAVVSWMVTATSTSAFTTTWTGTTAKTLNFWVFRI